MTAAIIPFPDARAARRRTAAQHAAILASQTGPLSPEQIAAGRAFVAELRAGRGPVPASPRTLRTVTRFLDALDVAS